VYNLETNTYRKVNAISRRINRLEIEINEKLGNDIVIALDSTGVKVACSSGTNGILEKVT
jgi:hypothetical protein